MKMPSVSMERWPENFPCLVARKWWHQEKKQSVLRTPLVNHRKTFRIVIDWATINWCALDGMNIHWYLTTGKNPASSNISCVPKVARRRKFVQFFISSCQSPPSRNQPWAKSQKIICTAKRLNADLSNSDHFVKCFQKLLSFHSSES